jgi:transcriptional regulator with GAF, ATPase, and Fis domain
VAIDASSIGVLERNPEGTIVLVNREAEGRSGNGRVELVGPSVDLLLSDAERALQTASADGSGGEPSAESAMSNPSQPAPADWHHALQEQLEFERFVAELSAQFINVPVEQIADASREALRRVCEHLDLDRAVCWTIGVDGLLSEFVSSTDPSVPSPSPALAPARFPWAIERVRGGLTAAFSTLAEVPDEIDRESYRAAGVQSSVKLPLWSGGQVAGAMGFHAMRAERSWTPVVMRRLGVIASVFGEVLGRRQRDEAVQAGALEARRLKEQLQIENVYLRKETRERLGQTRVVGRSPAMVRVLEQIDQVAATDATVLLLGETGTGKELFATEIHERGPRQGRAMVRVNCAAIPATLIESELFGREKGAFTGALARQVGRFELANHSTIFLDEIGDLPTDVQVKLLRVLEMRQIERLGSPRPIAVDTRIIAATHRDLEQLIGENAFREDLYYRLNVFPIQVPPLRERVQDIPLLVWRFVEEFSKAFGKRVDSIDKDNLAALQRYSWPGNIRELRNVVERAMIVATTPRLTIPLPLATAASAKRSSRLVDVEKEHIRGVLESTAWRVRGVGGAAERLGLKPTTLETRMAKLGVRRPGHA